jgi:archaemetzincin
MLFMPWIGGFVWREDASFTIAIQPLGPVSAHSRRAIKSRIEKIYFATVTILSPKQLPSEAFYPPRSRYRADRLLTLLAKNQSFDKIIGVTSVDISTTRLPYADWGVFGLAQTGKNSCVVSGFRLHKRGAISTTERLCRVAVHEVGHTLGLDHCPTPHCTMSDAKGALKTVDEEKGFCSLCRRRVNAIQ